MKFLALVYFCISTLSAAVVCESKIKAEVVTITKQNKDELSFNIRLLKNEVVPNKTQCQLSTFASYDIKFSPNTYKPIISGVIINLELKEDQKMTEEGLKTIKNWKILQ